jgi:hypothetical protein
MAEENLLKMVDAINKRISKRNDGLGSTFEKAEIVEDEENILVRYRNGARGMEIKECIADEPCEEIKDEDLPKLIKALKETQTKIGILESHYRDEANSKLTLKVSRLRGLGYCVFADVYEIGRIPELALKEVIERTDEGYKIEILSGADGFTYWKVTGLYTDEYDKFYRILEVLADYEE